MHKYTIVVHTYIGHGSYVIGFRRIRCKPEDLPKRMTDVTRGEPHFSIPGWPEVNFPNGVSYYAK